MRRLTFAGFTKRYVASLSLTGTSAIGLLVKEADAGNLRLREPLYLYAATNHLLPALLKASRQTSFYETYSQLAATFDEEALMAALENKSPELPDRYHKVWSAYRSVLSMPERDARVKTLMAAKIRGLQGKYGVSTYRICKDLSLSYANVNTWIKHGSANAISIKKARKVLRYLEGHAPQ